MHEPYLLLAVKTPHIGVLIVLDAELAGRAKRRVNSMTMASAMLASFLTEFIIDCVEHALVLTEQAEVVLDVGQE